MRAGNWWLRSPNNNNANNAYNVNNDGNLNNNNVNNTNNGVRPDSSFKKHGKCLNIFRYKL